MPDDEQTPDADVPEFAPEDAEGDRPTRGFVPEFVRKMAVTGLGALFMTEEGIRSLASQVKLPKEVLAFVVSQAEKTKEDVARVLTDELRKFFQSEKLRDEFLKLLAGMTIEVTAQVRLVPNKRKEGAGAEEEPLSPSITVTGISPKRHRKKKEE